VAGLSTLHDEGKLTVLPAVGYASPNQSHFTSRHYWEVGEVNLFGRWGWLGRYLDRHGAPDNPLQGLTLGWDLQPSLAAQEVPVATVSRPDQYDFWSPGVWGDVETKMLDAFGDLGGAPTGDAGLRYAREQVTAVNTLREQLLPFQSGYSTPGGVTYPNSELGRRFAGGGREGHRIDDSVKPNFWVVNSLNLAGPGVVVSDLTLDHGLILRLHPACEVEAEVGIT